MAHYDSQPNTLGATDNASGVAAILEVDTYESGRLPCPIFPELIVPYERIFRYSDLCFSAEPMKSSTLFLLITGLLVVGLWSYGTYFAKPRPPHQRPVGATSPGNRRVVKSDADWKKILDRSAYNVLRNSDTEWAGSSPLNDEHRAGTFVCAACRNPLFRSTAKFESGTGWPSFYQPILPNAIYTEADGNRTEVRCAVCDGHLGHVFEDGPDPTGLRYCMNGAAMNFVPASGSSQPGQLQQAGE